jgi:hypothetical protein
LQEEKHKILHFFTIFLRKESGGCAGIGAPKKGNKKPLCRLIAAQQSGFLKL